MEQTIKIAIYIHAFFGGLGLISGLASMLVKKGSTLHKKAGKLFSIGMLTSSLISLPITWLPNHENPFLFLIGVFTIYLVLSGNRALLFKPNLNKQVNWKDYTISGSMLLASAIMVTVGVLTIINKNYGGVLFLAFGIPSFILSFRDFKFFKNFKEIKNAWLENHIGKMVGAFIASVTAFIVAGIGIGTLIAWILPSVLGTLYILYWQRKIKPKRVKN